MNGKGHKLLAPVFSMGCSLLLVKSGLLDIAGSSVANAIAITAISPLSATWADADQLALMPTQIANGTAPKRKVKKYDNKEFYYIKVSEAEFKQRLKQNKNLKYDKTMLGNYLIYYENVRHPRIDMRIFCRIFKLMGLKKHRGWQSHSLILWTFIWLMIYCTISWIPVMRSLIAVFQVLILGLAFGYLSHLVVDKFTQQGLNDITDDAMKIFSNIPVLGNLFSSKSKDRKSRFRFARSDSDIYPYIVGFFIILIFWALLDFKSFTYCTSKFFKILYKVLSSLFKGIFSILKGGL